jgi:hypothetical protein
MTSPPAVRRAGAAPSMRSRRPTRLRPVSGGALVWILIGLVGTGLLAVSVPRIAASSLFGGTRSGSAEAGGQDVVALLASRGGLSLCRKDLTYTQCHPTAARFRPDETRIADCRTGFTCYEQAFGNVAYRKGPKVALGLLQSLMQTNGTVAADCHRMAHVIGAAALVRFRGDVARAFAAGSATCASGYYHGILERALRDAPRLGIVTVARRLCAGREVRRTIWLAYQCVHGLGHGLMLYSGYNLPFALDVCAKLATEADRQWCPGGVFMENIVTSYGGQSPWLKKTDPIYPCNVVKERDKVACYGMVTSWINQLNGYDWRATARTCRRAEPKYVTTCFSSLGRDASGQTVENPRGVLSICKVDARYWPVCVDAAATDFVYVFSNGRRAASLCRLMAAPKLEPGCFSMIGLLLGAMSTTPAKREASCRAITKTYAWACIRGTEAVRRFASSGRA